MSVDAAINAIYESLKNDNHEINQCIAALKTAMAAEGKKTVLIDPSKLAQNNRQGRKLMQSYFRQRGVAIDFAK